MKTKIRIFSLLIFIVIGAWMAPQKASAQNGSVSFQVFYDELSPYGTWIDSPEYGYVWVPDVAPGFTPYATNGYWVFTVDGWTWISNYAWGWAPFHYGRWYTDPYYGPMWVPDNQWGPGWVTWRRSGDYYGWAPIGPGISIEIAYGNGYNLPFNQWTFVRDRDFGRRNINNYYVNNSNNITIINNSVVINNVQVDRTRNVRYNAGPERVEVERRAGKKFATVAIKETSRPGQKMSNNQLQIYRPMVQKDVPSQRKPAPARVVDIKEVKPPAERGNKAQPQKPYQTTKDQPAKQQPTPPQQQQQQRKEQPAKQQPAPQQQQQQRKEQPAKQQPAPQQQQQRKEQPAKQQPAPQQQQQRKEQPAKQQPTQPQQHKDQPAKTQPEPQTKPPKTWGG